MGQSTVVHSTFVLERTFKAGPERVFAAFSDPATKRRWFFEGSGNTLDGHSLDFKVGGAEHAKIKVGTGPIAGKTIVNDQVYEDIQPGRRIVTSYRLSIDGKPFSASLATIELIPKGTGTDVIFTHQGAYFENSDGPEMRKGGWEHLFGKLAQELDEAQ